MSATGFFIEWLRYTPFFFTHAPLRKWHTYFESSYRIARGVTYAKRELVKCEDVWARGERRKELLEAVERGYRRNKTNECGRFMRP